MAEPYIYSREDVLNGNNEKVGTALFRTPRAGGEAEFRGTSRGVRQYERSAASRAGARAAQGGRYNRNALTNRIYGR